MRTKQGIAIITAISFMVVVLSFVSTAFIVSLSNTRLSGDQVSTTRAQLAAQAGIDEAILRIWHEATENINKTGSISGRRDIPDYRERWESVRSWSSHGNWGGANKLVGAVDADGNPIFGDPVTFTGVVDDGTGRTASYEVSIERRDDTIESTTLRITATGTLPNGSQRRLQQELAVAYPQFPLDFAFLTDFVNCTFCHSAFTSMEMGYSREHGMRAHEYLVDLTDEDAREAASEGKRRIKVAGLNDMRISTGWHFLNTLIAGTIYTRGPQNIMRDGGTGGGTAPKKNVFGPTYRAGSGIITAEDWEGFRPDQAGRSRGRLLECTKNPNDGNTGCNEPFGRFYEYYPETVEGQARPIDGEVPAVQQFPSPIVDENGDRRIDNHEWAAVMEDKAIGRLEDAAHIWFSPTDESGVPKGTESLTLPFKVRDQNVTIPGLQTGFETEVGRGIAGNLFLIGTDTDPIEIEGTVYVDGDLVIQGPVDPGNRGVFIVRNNIYIVGDVVYDCNGTAAGTDCTYYEPGTLPRLAMVSGGLMIIGDPNQSQRNKGFPNGFRSRNGTMPMQGELLAFNAKQHEKYVASQQAGAVTLEEIFVPRYYMYRQGDDLVFRCNFDGEDAPDGFDRKGTSECRDFIGHYGRGGRLRAGENYPCIAGQLDIFFDDDDNRMFDCPAYPGAEPGTGAGAGIGGRDLLEADQDEWDAYQAAWDDLYDDMDYDFVSSVKRDNNNRYKYTVGGIPVEQTGKWALRAEEIVVTDRNGNPIIDDEGNEVRPAYIYVSPSNNWLAPEEDLNGNNVPDYQDWQLELMEKTYGYQNAISAMEVLTGAWVEYGLNDNRSRNDQRPLRIDGLLFTNNAIMSYLPNRGRRSHTAGGLILNGSIISYETGLLIYGTGSGPDGSNKCQHGQNKGMFDAKNYLCVGLRLQYDRRLPSLIDLRVNVPVLLRARSQWLSVE